MKRNVQQQRPTRREFIRNSAAAAAGVGLVTSMPQTAHAAGSDLLRVGLVGCGGRGTKAAIQALTADKNTRLVAMADAFEDRLEGSFKLLKQSPVADRVQVEKDHRHAGFDGYQHVIAESDVVLLCATPHFRPRHLKACVEAGKHVFAEKPVAVDAPGVRSVLESTRLAKKKNLTIVSGLCWRYDTGLQKTIEQLHGGAIGDLTTLEATRYGAGVWVRQRQPNMTDMEYQMRNWYYFTWLSGDFIVEQFVHQLDQVAWALKDECPIRCTATGGRQVRTGKDHGHIYDHFNAIYEYESGVRVYAGTRHQPGCSYLTHCLAQGTKGQCDLMRYAITGESPWRWKGKRSVMHQLEHDAMYAALRAGRTINNGEYMANSTMMAILARMSAYTGKTITWKQAMGSQEDLSPATYGWSAAPPPAHVAMPGLTDFV